VQATVSTKLGRKEILLKVTIWMHQ
jgi:hypothetical protein